MRPSKAILAFTALVAGFFVARHFNAVPLLMIYVLVGVPLVLGTIVALPVAVIGMVLLMASVTIVWGANQLVVRKWLQGMQPTKPLRTWLLATWRWLGRNWLPIICILYSAIWTFIAANPEEDLAPDRDDMIAIQCALAAFAGWIGTLLVTAVKVGDWVFDTIRTKSPASTTNIDN